MSIMCAHRSGVGEQEQVGKLNRLRYLDMSERISVFSQIPAATFLKQNIIAAVTLRSFSPYAPFNCILKLLT